MASLRALGEDRGVVAAVIAPWTAPPAGAIELLAEHGVPVVTLSWAWGPPEEERALALLRSPSGHGRRCILLSARRVSRPATRRSASPATTTSPAGPSWTAAELGGPSATRSS